MKLIVTEKIGQVLEIQKKVTTLNIMPFDTGAGKIPLSTILAAEDLIVGSAAGAVKRLAKGNEGDNLTVSGGILAYAPPLGGVSSNASAEGRLTLESGVAVSTTDQTAKTVLYYTFFGGNRISLYSNSAWNRRIFTELSVKATDAQTGTTTNGNKVISGLTDTSQLVVGMEITGTNVGAASVIATIDSSTQVTGSVNSTGSASNTMTFKLPANKVYDVFIFDNSGTPKMKIGPVWTNTTTRATALALQDGIYVLTGDPTMRFLGTICTTATAGQIEDSIARRLVWNYYNRVIRNLYATDGTDTWTYTTATWRAANNNTTDGVGRFAAVIGVAEDLLEIQIIADASNGNASQVSVSAGVGVDVTNVNSAQLFGGMSFNSHEHAFTAEYRAVPVAGYHFYQRLEYSDVANTTTWIGDAGGTKMKTGMIGSIKA